MDRKARDLASGKKKLEEYKRKKQAKGAALRAQLDHDGISESAHEGPAFGAPLARAFGGHVGFDPNKYQDRLALARLASVLGNKTNAGAAQDAPDDGERGRLDERREKAIVAGRKLSDELAAARADIAAAKDLTAHAAAGDQTPGGAHDPAARTPRARPRPPPGATATSLARRPPPPRGAKPRWTASSSSATACAPSTPRCRGCAASSPRSARRSGGARRRPRGWSPPSARPGTLPRRTPPRRSGRRRRWKRRAGKRARRRRASRVRKPAGRRPRGGRAARRARRRAPRRKRRRARRRPPPRRSRARAWRSAATELAETSARRRRRSSRRL